MKVFVTGGTGFIGGHVVRKLRNRGDDVVALVRDPNKGKALSDIGCELVEGGLSDTGAIKRGLEGCDAAIHMAAIYEVGIPKGQRQPMYEANVQGTENVLRAALEAKTSKVVYVSTVAAFGNTEGKVVDETYQHKGNYTSYYDETKHKAHLLARRLIDDEDLPCVIVQPGGVYGPEDHSQIGNMVNQFLAGRMPMIPFPDLGFNLVHVDDVADGVLLALDKGGVGEQYVLGGQIATMREAIQTLAKVTGKKAPSRAMPTAILKGAIPIGPIIGPLMGYPPNFRELISSAEGVTWWARHDKAIEQLGYSPRGLEQGIRDTLEAEGKLPAAA